MKVISVEQAKKDIAAKKALLVDVRTGAEFEEVHAKPAINIPLDKISDVTKEIEHSKKDVYVICKSGARSQMACKQLAGANTKHVHTVEGGTLAWIQHEFPTIRGKSKWDLERQVRFVAGILVLVGAILSFTTNYWFILLSGFVGAGLVFASVTNTCTMGMMLAKLPYNQTNNFSLERMRQQLAK